MDVPADILEELKCSRCSGYLSRAPVFLQHDGAAACGQCSAPERPATRNTQYEATARMLKFPCKYRELGCLETVPFAKGQQHEAVCEHRQSVCPVLGDAACAWLGPRRGLLQHCREQHPDQVLDSPTTLVHDISKASVQTYLLRALQVLFLLHTKVCVASGKMYHAVRYLGAAGEAAGYEFTVAVKRGVDQLTRTGQVAPEGCRAIQEDSSLAFTTNSLLDVLGGLAGATFTVTVQRKVVPCAGCEAEVTVFRFRDAGGWRSEHCAPARRACENQGCTYTDIGVKTAKHEWWFCEQRAGCWMCRVPVPPGTWSAHYTAEHQDITYRAGSTWRATCTGAVGRDCFFTSVAVAGTAGCWYTLDDTRFDLWVYTPVPSERLREFRCVVTLTDPATAHARTYTPDIAYIDGYDWRIEVDKRDFQPWNTEFDVSLDIIQTEP